MKKARFLIARISAAFKSKLTSHLSPYLLDYPRLYASLAIVTSSTITAKVNARQSSSKHRVLNILAIDSPGAADDLQAIAEASSRDILVFTLIDHRYFAQLFRRIVGEGPHDYGIQYKKSHRLRLTYTYAVCELLLLINRDMPIDGIVNFNFVYYYTRDLETVCRQFGIPFITLMKECLRTNAYALSAIDIYATRVDKYNGDMILVHNLQTKEILEQSGITDAPVIVSGQPRSDLLRRTKALCNKKQAKHFTIIYFMVSERAGLPYFSGYHYDSSSNLLKPKSWGININTIPLNTIFSFLELHSNVSVIIKGKPNIGYCRVRVPPSLKRRVLITHGNPNMAIYNEADLVLGFNSTCLVEAHLSAIPTASIEFNPFNPDDVSDYLLPLPTCVPRIKSVEELNHLLNSLVENLLVTPTVDTVFVKDVLDNQNFDSGFRTANAMIECIDQHIRLSCTGSTE